MTQVSHLLPVNGWGEGLPEASLVVLSEFWKSVKEIGKLLTMKNYAYVYIIFKENLSQWNTVKWG